MVEINRLHYIPKKNHIRPQYALVLHGNTDTNGLICATRHTFKSDATLSIGQLISIDAIQREFAQLTAKNDSTTIDFLPENLLFESDSLVVWHTKRFIGDMWFRVATAPECLTIEWPALIFIASKQSKKLKVFATATNSRPTMDTKLYHAPVMNVDEKGVLCQGTATLPSVICTSTIKDCSDTLFDSQFTHVNHKATLRNHRSSGEHIGFWRSKAKSPNSRAVRVTAKDFSPTKLRLCDLLLSRNV